MMRLGGVLGQLPIEKTFELAKVYHADRRKFADRTMSKCEKERMQGLFSHIVHGDWSDPKNAMRRRQHMNSIMGKEWEGLDRTGKEESMTAYVIMVDQIHKGFSPHVGHKVCKVKAKEAMRAATAEREKKIADELAKKERTEKEKLMKITKKRKPLNSKGALYRMMNGKEIDVPYRISVDGKMVDFLEDPLTYKGIPVKGKEKENTTTDHPPTNEEMKLTDTVPAQDADAGDNPGDGMPDKESDAAEDAPGGSDQPGGSRDDEYDQDAPSGSKNDQNDNGDDNGEGADPPENPDAPEGGAAAAEPPKETKENSTQTCPGCLDGRCARIRARKLALKSAQIPRADKATQTDYVPEFYMNRQPKKKTKKQKKTCKWDAVPEVKAALENELCTNIDEKFRSAKEHLFNKFHSQEVAPKYETMISMLAMIAVVDSRPCPELTEEFADQEAFLDDFKKSMEEYADKPRFQLQAEFIMEVIDHCPEYAQGLASGLMDAISDEYPQVKESGSETVTDEEIDVVTVSSDERTAKQIRNAKKKAQKKKAKKRHAELLARAAQLREHLPYLRDLRLQEVRDKIARGELPEDALAKEEEAHNQLNHSKYHSIEDCEDSIEYFAGRVWDTYKACTPKVYTTDDIRKWCEEKLRGEGASTE